MKLFIFLLIVLTSIPVMHGQSDFDFGYREVYFFEVSIDRTFVTRYQTQPLDAHWGLWGHNLNKWIDVNDANPELLALHGGKRVKDQFCFSDSRMFELIAGKIEDNAAEFDHYMISPLDNMKSCTCDECSILGNTEKNASPAIFYLLDKLSTRFPRINFFTTVYNTVKTKPAIKTNPNVGVFISTIDYQQGLPYTKVGKEPLKQEFRSWSNKVSEVYVWEYALNYDHYFDFYPNIYVLQDNLKFLKQAGVTGVFINGGETYSAMQEVKAAVIARLLIDLDQDVSELIRDEVKKYYPTELSQDIASFYIDLGLRFRESNHPLSIYSGIEEARKKYLTLDKLQIFTEKLDDYLERNNPSKTVAALKATVNYLQLELMRNRGVRPGGYATNSCENVDVKPQINSLLKGLSTYAAIANIDVINERGDLLKDYIQAWNETIISNSTKNTALTKRIMVNGTLDYGYDNVDALNDMTFGFVDYNSNWLINSSKSLQLYIPLASDEEVQSIQIGFLNDPRHGIYLPQKVVVKSGEFKREFEVDASGELKRFEIGGTLDVEKPGKVVSIRITAAERSGKNTWAIDEILFNSTKPEE
jgi:hypothetical protein